MSFQKSLDKKQPAGLDFIISCLALDKCLNVYIWLLDALFVCPRITFLDVLNNAPQLQVQLYCLLRQYIFNTNLSISFNLIGLPQLFCDQFLCWKLCYFWYRNESRVSEVKYMSVFLQILKVPCPKPPDDCPESSEAVVTTEPPSKVLYIMLGTVYINLYLFLMLPCYFQATTAFSTFIKRTGVLFKWAIHQLFSFSKHKLKGKQHS